MKINRKERAQSMVEMAISFTMVMFLLSGVVDLGRAFFAVIALRDAVQEGAVYAATHPQSVNPTKIRAQLSSSGPIDLTDTSKVRFFVEWPDAKACAEVVGTHANGITVRVEYDFEFIMPLMGPLIPGTEDILTIPVSVTNTILYPPC